jgi:hypothetical protein
MDLPFTPLEGDYSGGKEAGSGKEGERSGAEYNKTSPSGGTAVKNCGREEEA